MEEYKIGEVFQFGKKKLKCVKGWRCSDCAMNDLEECEPISRFLGACKLKDREDQTGVIFVELKKEYEVGEIFQFGRIKLKCVEEYTRRCYDCVLNQTGKCNYFVGECENTHRLDNKSVIFVEVKEEENGRI